MSSRVTDDRLPELRDLCADLPGIPGLEIAALIDEVIRTRALINSPVVDDFLRAVPLEAAHQVERWGKDDAKKRARDWYDLVVWLASKATLAAAAHDDDKHRHHVITAAAALLNWHRQAQQRALANQTWTGCRCIPAIGGGLIHEDGCPVHGSVQTSANGPTQGTAHPGTPEKEGSP